MNIVVIDPDTRTVRAAIVTSMEIAKNLYLGSCDPCSAVPITETQMLMYQPFACSGGSRFFFSRKLEQHFAGSAIVVGSNVGGGALSCGRGMVEAMKRDVLFLGDVEQAKKTMANMVKFTIGAMKPHSTMQ